MTIRNATPADVEAIVEMIRGIAEYEKLEHQFEATPAKLHEALFGGKPVAQALIAEGQQGEKMGYAIFCYNFSTFLCKAGIYLEDLFVKPEHRANGVGKALFKAVAQIGVNEDCGRMEWVALDWNAPALDFYKAKGAQALPEWVVHRFDRQQLLAAAQE